MSAGLDGGGGESYTGDADDVDDYDGGGGGGGDGGGGFVDSVTNSISGWGDLTLPAALQSFLSNPQNFIIGAVATAILETFFGVVTTGITMLIRVFLGTNPGEFNAPGETLGLADVPVYVVDLLINVGGSAGETILTAIGSLNEPVYALASNAGPATPLLITAFVVGEVIVVLWLLQRLVYVLADVLQLGGLTE